MRNPPKKTPCRICGEMTFGAECPDCFKAGENFLAAVMRATEAYVSYVLKVKKK